MIPFSVARVMFLSAFVSATIAVTPPGSAPQAGASQSGSGTAQAAPAEARRGASPGAAQNDVAAQPTQSELGEYVKKQFGESCQVASVRPHTVNGSNAADPPQFLLTADLDGDGAEDAIIVAHCKNPLPDEQQFGYKVIDPYDAYYGYGDPRVTQSFSVGDTENEHALLLVHNWRASQPKLKFVVINLPFDKLAVRNIVYKKKPRAAVVATESGLMESAIFWDGKRYRYEPGTGEAE